MMDEQGGWLKPLAFALLFLLLLFLLFGAKPAGADSPIVVDHDDVALFDNIPPEYEQTVLTMFYTDRSVGANVFAGLDCLALEPQAALWHCRSTTHADTRYSTTWPDVDWSYPHPNRWGYVPNGGPAGTITSWDAKAAVGERAQVWGWFPSYLDAPGNVGRWASNMAPVVDKARTTDTTLLAFTSSLARNTGAEYTALNDEIRIWAAANNLPLLDAADILSHSPDGSPCYDNRDGVPYVNGSKSENYPDDGINTPAICPQYTTEVEGGHLGSVAVGKIRLAKAMWVMMAQLAGWIPDDMIVPPTATIIAPTSTATVEPTMPPTATQTPVATIYPTNTPDIATATATPVLWAVCANLLITHDARTNPLAQTVWYTTIRAYTLPVTAGVQIVGRIDNKVLTCVTGERGHCVMQYRWPGATNGSFVLQEPEGCQ